MLNGHDMLLTKRYLVHRLHRWLNILKTRALKKLCYAIAYLAYACWRACAVTMMATGLDFLS